jgi:hypothetical protein
MTQPKQPKKPLKLVVPSDLELTYANLVRIAHMPSELVLDFAHMIPGDQNAKVVSRVLMSPLSAKLFYNALGENLAKYEANYGEIQIPQKQQTLADQLFRPFTSPGNAEDDEEEEE